MAEKTPTVLDVLRRLRDAAKIEHDIPTPPCPVCGGKLTIGDSSQPTRYRCSALKTSEPRWTEHYERSTWNRPDLEQYRYRRCLELMGDSLLELAGAATNASGWHPQGCQCPLHAALQPLTVPADDEFMASVGLYDWRRSAAG